MNNSIKKGVVVSVVLLFISVSVIPTTGTAVEKKSAMSFDGNTLYVGGLGPSNYTTIQSAIDDASDGDTVFVYDDSSPYYENLNVSKSIYLIGEDRETTVINGSGNGDVVNITADEVTISGFTVQDYRNGSSGHTGLIFIQSDYNIISGNIITGNTSYGIRMQKSEFMYQSEFNIISSNIITGLTDGIALWFGRNNNISGNIIKDCMTAIDLIWCSNNNSIIGNTLTNNTWGIATGSYCINDVISLNNISYNFYGIAAINCFNYKITKNNFIGNNWGAFFGYFLLGALRFGFEYKSLRDIRSTIKWDGNYWNKPRSFPKPIFGRLPPSGCIPWFQFDWHPAQEPYDIGVG